MEKIDEHSKTSGPHSAIDSPRANERVYDQCISIAGSIRSEESDPAAHCIRAYIDNVCIGETRILTHENSSEHRLGYKILGRISEPIVAPRLALISVTLSRDGEDAAHTLGEIPVQLLPARLPERHYGEVVPPDQAKVLHRDNIYGSGPPVEQPSPEALSLILGYLPPRSSIVDVGCGAGAYGPGLVNAGHKWLGLEVNDHCLDLLAGRGLPFRKLDGATPRFPCVDREFDHAICIEVLEHIDEPDIFLKEIARIIRGRALFSVPNLEVLPYFKDWEVAPWHLLEAGHKNFFTRASLRALLGKYFARVEVFSYGEHPLRTRDQIALHLHLFAAAESFRAAFGT
jgi:2-polyprenyl-3-methyl-5-hydroxy-6-metoxy-1,4-benzoquinol methylase